MTRAGLGTGKRGGPSGLVCYFFLFFPFSFSPAADVSDRLFSRGNNTLNHPFLLPLPVGIEKALEKRENMDSESKGSYSVADK